MAPPFLTKRRLPMRGSTGDVGCVDPGSLGIENRFTFRKPRAVTWSGGRVFGICKRRKKVGNAGPGARGRNTGAPVHPDQTANKITGPAMPLQARKECRGERFLSDRCERPVSHIGAGTEREEEKKGLRAAENVLGQFGRPWVCVTPRAQGGPSGCSGCSSGTARG